MDLRSVFRLHGGKFFSGDFSTGELFTFMREFILSVVLLLFLLPIASSAEEPVGFYMTGEASVFALDLPDYSAATVKLIDTNTFLAGPYDRLTTNNGFQSGPMGTLSAGWRTKNGIFFEARGFAANLHSTQTTVFDCPTLAVQYGWMPIDGGDGAMGAIIGNREDMHASTTRDVEYHGGSALVGWDVPMKNGRVSPFAGISYMELNQDFSSYCYNIQDPHVNYMSLEEDMDAKYLGILAGIRVHYDFDGLEFHAEGKLGVYNLDADYDGFQSAQGASTTASDTYSDTCMKATLSGGVTKRAGNWIYGVNAGLEYLTVPTIRSSTTYSGTSNGSPSHLDTEECLGLKGGLTISYAF
jgi:hypothetical protein